MVCGCYHLFQVWYISRILALQNLRFWLGVLAGPEHEWDKNIDREIEMEHLWESSKLMKELLKGKIKRKEMEEKYKYRNVCSLHRTFQDIGSMLTHDQHPA